MHIPKWRWIVLAVLGLLVWQLWPRVLGVFGWSFTDYSSDQSVYYRVLAKYQHDDEVIDFDIVAGCNVKITGYGDGGSSFDAFRAPAVFAKKTKDGGAIWQLMPDACQGHSSENGQVPEDFLPGAIWFPDSSDFSFGIAYVTEDAFESPISELKFLGASVHPATVEDWKAFQPIAAQNLIDPTTLAYSTPVPSDDEIKTNLWNKEKLAEWWRASIECRAVHRYHITDPAGREAVKRLWPSSRPKFWTPTSAELETVGQYLFGKAILDGIPAYNYFPLGTHRAYGFPTRARGGTILSNHKTSEVPSSIFPIRADDGIPWATPALSTAKTIYRDVEIEGGAKLGFAYCYSVIWGRGNSGALHIPDYGKRNFSTRVDGEAIVGEDRDPAAPSSSPRPFFERDEYFYLLSSFNLK